MEKRQIGKHGLEVSALCLGTMTFGYQIDEKVSREILDKAMEHRMVFMDTSDAYPLGGPIEVQGETESIIGRWMKDQGNREDVVLATKCFVPTKRGLNNKGLSRKHIMEAVEASLRRLQTDYIDLYQSHGFDPNTPIEETLRAFEDLVISGKVRYLGCSNYPAWRLADAILKAERLGIPGYQCIQPRYNLLYRDIEPDLLPLCIDQGLGVIVYNPLAGGFLSGKYQVGQSPEDGTRFTVGTAGEMYQARYWHESQFSAVEKLKEVVQSKDQNMVSISIAWVLRQPGISSALIGATRPDQLDANLAALDVEFDQELLEACEAVWWSLPRRPVAPGYR